MKIKCIPIYLIGFLFAAWQFSLPDLPEEGIDVEDVFIPTAISYGSSPFGKSYLMKGYLGKIPCTIYTPLHKQRPLAKHHLKIKGKLIPKTFPTYVLKPTYIEPLPNTRSLAEWRFQIKDAVRKKMNSLFSTKESAAFLLSMITGEIDDRLLSLQFNRLGLLHLLGVSGFQFSLLALLLSWALRSLRASQFVLIALLALYTFILGNSPPIQRAFIGTTLYIFSRMKGLTISPLNALGAALLWELLLDPLVIFQMGFQFSFLCTAAIFMVYPAIRDFFKRWLPGRTLEEIRALPIIDRIGHTITFLCREAVALNLSIHLVSLPLILYHFHKFPLLCLVYNLFLPPLVSFAYFFLILGLFPLADLITGALIKIASHPPTLFDFQLRMPVLSYSFAILLIALILLFNERGRLFDRIWRRDPLI